MEMKLKANLRLNKLSRVGVGGWLEQLGIKLISTQVVVEVEVRVELGNTCREMEKIFSREREKQDRSHTQNSC